MRNEFFRNPHRAYFEQRTNSFNKLHTVEAETKIELLSKLVQCLVELGMDKEVVIIALFQPNITQARIVDRYPDGTLRDGKTGRTLILE